jgi:molecular chaperone DnaK (HSP70)
LKDFCDNSKTILVQFLIDKNEFKNLEKMASINEILNRDHRTTSNHKITVDHQSQRSDEDEFDHLDNCDKCQNESHSDKKSNHFAKSYTKFLRKSK